jgi:hypothetical protein
VDNIRNNGPESIQGESGVGEEIKDGRREALKKMGKYALYVAPAVIAVLRSDKAGAATIPPP